MLINKKKLTMKKKKKKIISGGTPHPFSASPKASSGSKGDVSSTRVN